MHPADLTPTFSRASYNTSPPVLFKGAVNDRIAIPSVQEQMVQTVLEEMTAEIVKSGHWLHPEQSGEVKDPLEHFFGHLVAM